MSCSVCTCAPRALCVCVFGCEVYARRNAHRLCVPRARHAPVAILLAGTPVAPHLKISCVCPPDACRGSCFLTWTPSYLWPNAAASGSAQTGELSRATALGFSCLAHRRHGAHPAQPHEVASLTTYDDNKIIGRPQQQTAKSVAPSGQRTKPCVGCGRHIHQFATDKWPKQASLHKTHAAARLADHRTPAAAAPLPQPPHPVAERGRRLLFCCQAPPRDACTCLVRTPWEHPPMGRVRACLPCDIVCVPASSWVPPKQMAAPT